MLSFAHRLTGVILGLTPSPWSPGWWRPQRGRGPTRSYRASCQSWLGLVVFVGGTFCFFLHLCGGIRHLFWDAGRGFELRTIYASGWAVLAVSTILTAAAWVVGSYLVR